MALRIHFPWGWLFAVLGFAILGAAGAYLTALDFHGHLYRLCALHAAGAAVLGAFGWLFSERMSHVGNLNTSPFVRLLVSGFASVLVAGWVVAPYAEFTTGAGIWWLEVAGVLLYVAAGVLPLIGGVAFFVGFGTLFAAQRGGTSVMDALRPLRGRFALGLFLIAAVAGSAVYLRTDIRNVVVGITPDAPRSSGWIDRERRLYTNVLAGSACEVLVPAFDAPEDKPGLDRPARSLMARYVAAEIQAQTGLCVVDPTLAARALGANARSHDLSSVTAVANTTGARWIVRGGTALGENGRTVEVAVQLLERQPGAKPVWLPTEATGWGPVPFSDAFPPEAAFQAIAAAVVEHLGLPGERPPRASAAPSRELPEALAQLASDPGSAHARAERLQLVASTYARGDVTGEQLWERSLVALADAPIQDEAARILRARAALHLYRRPYAIASLEGLSSSDARAARAIAQGSPLEAEQVVSRSSNRALQLVTRLESEALRADYGRGAGQGDRRAAAIAAFPGYAGLLYGPMSTDAEQRDAQVRVERELTSMGVEVQGHGEDLARHYSRIAMLDAGTLDQSVERAAAIERGCRALWVGRAAQWAKQAAADRLAEWDVYDALCAANRAAVVGIAKTLRKEKLAPQAALSRVAALDPLFGGYPPLQAEAAAALRDVRRQDTTPDPTGEERARRLARDLVHWEGESELTRGTDQAVLPDEPPRPWRPGQKTAAQQVRLLGFSQTGFELLPQAYATLRQAGQSVQAEQLLVANQDRFAGHPARDSFLLQRAEERGDIAGYVALLHQRVLEKPQEWSAYLALAQGRLRAREPDLAQQTLLAYPGFADRAAAAQHAENAKQGAELLLNMGEPELARPLLELATRDTSGSAAALGAAMRLAQITGNLRGARDLGRQLHERHQTPNALAQSAELSFLLGESEEGWRAFYEAAKRFESFGPWRAALAGHRLAQTPDNEVTDFARRWKSLSGEAKAEAKIRESFLFDFLFLDRPREPKTFENFISFAGRSGERTRQQLAAGFQAFRKGDYAAASEVLLELNVTGPKTDTLYALPYLAASLTNADHAADAEALVNSAMAKDGRGLHSLLATAYLRGLTGDTARAIDALWQAQIVLAETDPATTIPPDYQILETCEKLHEWTKEDRYRQLLVDLARRQQKAWPQAAAYAFEAKYAADAGERERALAIAQHLDANSEHLAGFTEAQRKRAGEWFARNNPFRGKS